MAAAVEEEKGRIVLSSLLGFERVSNEDGWGQEKKTFIYGLGLVRVNRTKKKTKPSPTGKNHLNPSFITRSTRDPTRPTKTRKKGLGPVGLGRFGPFWTDLITSLTKLILGYFLIGQNLI